MLYKRILVCTLLVITVLANSCDSPADKSEVSGPVDLKFNFYADSTYRYSIKNNIALTQQIDKENSIVINQNMTLTSAYKVVAVKPGQKTVSVTYERIMMSSGNQLYSLDYDSENDNGTDIMYEDLRNLIDENFKMTVSDKGDIISSEPIMKSSIDGVGAYNFSDSSIRKIMVHSLQVYPGTSVQPGQIWEKTFSTSVGFANVRIKNKYQLVSVKNGIAHVELQGRITSDNAEQAQNSSMALNGTQSGSLDIAVNSGLVQNGKIAQQLSGNMDITGETTPVTIESNIYIMGTIKNTNGSL
ncbi:MAG: hypothetical protein H6550_11350 [Chitinophagales bacterium]|nr:hypothetical protein [Chitinophagales bacterium]